MASSTPMDAPLLGSSAERWLVAAAVMASAMMELIDTAAVNVSLPYIGGSLAATASEATWVLTSYLIANAVVLPIAGWLANYFGRKRLLMGAVTGFTAASVLCGLAPTLPLLIIFRVIQGAAGGSLQPATRAILLETFPREERGHAMAIFGVGIVVAPILAPVLGGWLTTDYSWRWIFFINVPVCVIALHPVDGGDRGGVFDDFRDVGTSRRAAIGSLPAAEVQDVCNGYRAFGNSGIRAVRKHRADSAVHAGAAGISSDHCRILECAARNRDADPDARSGLPDRSRVGYAGNDIHGDAIGGGRRVRIFAAEFKRRALEFRAARSADGRRTFDRVSAAGDHQRGSDTQG